MPETFSSARLRFKAELKLTKRESLRGSMKVRPTTIFFDVGNTLLFPNRERILAPLAEHGVVPSTSQWTEIERRTKLELDAALIDGCADHEFWANFYEHLLSELGIEDDILRTALTDATRQSANWDKMRPGTKQALLRLGRKYRLGAISNADGKIAEVLERCGIAACLRSITDSGVVGKAKPHPAIFEAALATLNARPQESLYVGDVYSVDYLGATGVGMQAVLMDVAGVYREREWPRVESLEEVERLLGRG